MTTGPLETLTARVFYVDQTGRSGTAVADITVPKLPTDTSDATVAIRTFSVVGYSLEGRFYYRPRLTLAETTGRGNVSIVGIDFQLLDVGPSGRVPQYRQPIEVPAGQTIVLDMTGWGPSPWIEIDSVSEASRVLVVIYFVDGSGRGGSVSAVADVSR